MRLALLTTLALALLSAAADSETPPHASGSPSSACSPAKQRGRFFITLPVDGVQRSALVNVPPRSDGTRPLPVVLVFHGASSTGPATEEHLGLSQIGNRYGFVAVYPTAHANYFNYKGTGPGAEDDVEFTRALLDQLDRQVCVDDSRIYATGGSNGGAFVARLGCEMSDRLAAIAPVAGVYGQQPPCHPTRPISVLEIHGSNDRYGGWPALGWGPVPTFLSQWMKIDGCPGGPPVYHTFALGAVLSDKYCSSGTVVAHIKLFGGIHAWPGALDLTRAPAVDYAVNASLAVWQFFSCQARTARTGPGCPAPQLKASKARSG